MKNSVMRRSKNSVRFRALLKVLSAHYKSLKVAGSDKHILENYVALLGYLEKLKKNEIEVILGKIWEPIVKTRFSEPHYDESKVKNMTLEQIEKIIYDETTSRNHLENIAIYRFQVPQGSMRSFSNRRLLVEKLLTLIRNERAHATIEALARR